jgi:exonuclease I
MEKGTKQDLEMLIDDLDNFYSYRGRNFFKLLEEDERINFEDRIYHLYNDLQDKMDEIEKENKS